MYNDSILWNTFSDYFRRQLRTNCFVNWYCFRIVQSFLNLFCVKNLYFFYISCLQLWNFNSSKYATIIHSFIELVPPTRTVILEAVFRCWLLGCVPGLLSGTINIAAVSCWDEKAISKLRIYAKRQFLSHIQTDFKIILKGKG